MATEMHHTTQAEVDALVTAAAVLRREAAPTAADEAEAIAADLRVRLLGQERLLHDVLNYKRGDTDGSDSANDRWNHSDALRAAGGPPPGTTVADLDALCAATRKLADAAHDLSELYHREAVRLSEEVGA